MARNEVLRDADHLSLPVPAGTRSGRPVLVGSLVGVTQTAEGQGGNPAGRATVWRKGAHAVPVDGAITAVGTRVYITPDGAGLTTAADSGGTTPIPNILWGYALETKGAGVGTIDVALARV
jgi:predicted RecA/RadA family phage recombinase